MLKLPVKHFIKIINHKITNRRIWAGLHKTSLVGQTVKRLSTMRETRVQSLGQEDPLGKEMAIHSSTIAWNIPWTEEPGRLQSMGSQRVGHDWATSFLTYLRASLVTQLVKNAGDLGSIPGLGRSPGQGKGYPPQYSGLEKSMYVYGVTKCRTRLSNFH